MISRAPDTDGSRRKKKKKSKGSSRNAKAAGARDASEESGTNRLSEESTVERDDSGEEAADAPTDDAVPEGEDARMAGAVEGDSEESPQGADDASAASGEAPVASEEAAGSDDADISDHTGSSDHTVSSDHTGGGVELTEEEEEEIPHLEGERLRACIEAILFASPDPVSRRRLYRLIPEADNAAIREALLELEGELLSTHRGYVLVEEGSGFRLLSKSEFAPYVARLRGEKRKVRLSSAAFEALAVIAYRQPARRADLEAIRGVQCGAILKNLMEWNLIRVVGHDDTPGRPLLYGTTGDFLEMLGLSAIDDLPEPERLRERGEDRGLQVLDRIIEEGGGLPRVAESGDDPGEGPAEISEDPVLEGAVPAAPTAIAEEDAGVPESSDDATVGEPDGEGDFDLDLEEEDPTAGS